MMFYFCSCAPAPPYEYQQLVVSPHLATPAGNAWHQPFQITNPSPSVPHKSGSHTAAPCPVLPLPPVTSLPWYAKTLTQSPLSI